MELLEGEDLGVRLSRLGPRDPPEIVQIVRQTAKALSRAHQLGVVHRDIKPANLFILDADGEIFVKVLDFGIAKQQGDIANVTASGSLVGSPLYMSPEQLFSSKHVDFRTDLWSLAAVAYHGLTGKPPFHGETPAQVFVQIDRGNFTLPSALRRDIPPAVDAWFLRALRRDPSQRFASAHSMAEELEAAFTRRASASDPDHSPGLEQTTLQPPVHTMLSGPPPLELERAPGAALPRTLSGVATGSGHDAHGGRSRSIAAAAAIALLGGLLAVTVGRLEGERSPEETPPIQATEPGIAAPQPVSASDRGAPDASGPGAAAPAELPREAASPSASSATPAPPPRDAPGGAADGPRADPAPGDPRAPRQVAPPATRRSPATRPPASTPVELPLVDDGF